MLHSLLATTLLFSFTVSNYQVDAFLPSRLSAGSRSQIRLLSSNEDYYNLLNRNEMAVSSVTSSLNPYEIEELNKGLVGSPGFVSSVPISTQAQSRKELAKMVVSAAVLYLSLNIRIKEMADKLDYSNKVDAAKNNGAPVIMSNGIQYTDMVPIVTKSGENLLSEEAGLAPKRGDEMILMAKLFYNGLQINKGSNNVLLSFMCLEDGKFEEVYSIENSNFTDVPLNGLKEAMRGMNYNNRRKAIIPAYLAFGEEGLTPFIPGGAAVMYELTLTKKI
jgi:FKBP-type peptidyl-prolyl cis-trans isomerase